jgi:hypothetical protein
LTPPFALDCTLAVWILRERETHKEWIYSDRENPSGRSLGSVSPETDSTLLKEWVVMRALPGDFIVMEGRAWIMCAPIGVKIEFKRDDGRERAVISNVRLRFPL